MEIEQGMVAVVTGAGSGIGRALAERAAARGMKVVAADIEQPQLDATVEPRSARRRRGRRRAHRRLGGRRRRAPGRQRVSTFGGVNLLCNNAGVFSGGLMWERTLADWEWVMGVNLYGLVNAVEAFVPRLLEAGGPAHIVNTASMGGLVTNAFSGPYYTSKFAAVGLTECLAHDLAASRRADRRVGAGAEPGRHGHRHLAAQPARALRRPHRRARGSNT